MASTITPSPNSPRLSSWIVIAMMAMAAIPAAIALHSVSVQAKLDPSAMDPTPYGYTKSLLLFIIPMLVIGFWFLPSEGLHIPKRSFWLTVGILVPLGCGLDFFFANTFFTFKNKLATLQITAPALHGGVPVEEYIFYLTGFIAVLLLYTWLNEYWLSAYNVPDYPANSKRIHRLLQFHPESLILGAILILLAVVYKKLYLHETGFPGYFTFLVAGALIPSAGFFLSARPFINWRAFSLTMFFFLSVSLLWEATLAVPYGWWGYQDSQMLGIHINAWSGLPLEAVCVWIAVTYTTTIVFEIIKIWLASEKDLKTALLGAGMQAE